MRRTARGIAAPGCRVWLSLAERARHTFAAWGGQVEVELGPLRARDGPFVLVAEMVFAVTGADGELHRRLLHYGIVDVLEPIIEEAQLVASSVVAVERMVMRTAMDAQLLILGGGSHVALGCAAQV